MDPIERLKFIVRLQDKAFAAHFLSKAYQSKLLSPKSKESNKEFLQAVGMLIKASGTTISSLSASTGLHRAQIHKVIRGEGNPTIDTLQLLLTELGFTVAFVPLEQRPSV